MGLKSSYSFARLEDVDVLITDRPPGKKVRQTLRKAGGKLLVAEEERT
jgi:DeoR/GlpR family transcriptional regulator of sugar metabolism